MWIHKTYCHAKALTRFKLAHDLTKWNGLFYYIVINLVAVAVYFLHSIPLSSAIYIQLFLNINRDVLALVKFGNRSGPVSYVGKVVAPGD